MGDLARIKPVITHNYSLFNAGVAKYIDKLEQPDPRVAAAAFRDKARGVGHVLKWLGIAGLLILLGLAVVLWRHERKEAVAADTTPPAVFPKVAGLDQGGQANGSGQTKR